MYKVSCIVSWTTFFLFFSVRLECMNKLVKAFRQQEIVTLNREGDGFNNDSGPLLDLGRVSLYFVKKPTVTVVPSLTKGSKAYQKKIFIFPKTTIKDIKIAKKINNYEHEHYKIKIEQITVPIEGIKFSVVYDDSKVVVDYEINSYHGVIFKFYNKELIGLLKNSGDFVLRTALNFKKSIFV